MKRRRIFNFLTGLLLTGVLLTAMPPNIALAGENAGEPRFTETGNLTVALEEHLYGEIPKSPAVVISFYRIGVLDEEGGQDWKMNEGFEDYGVLEAETTSDMVKIAGEIAEDISSKGLTPQDVTLSGGRASASGLPLGIYLGVLKEGPEWLTVDPFIFTFPTMADEEELWFDIDMVLKAAYVTPSPTPTPAEITPTTIVRPSPPPKRVPPKETPPKTTPKRPATGDQTDIYPLFALLLGSAVLIGLIAGRKRRTMDEGGAGRR